jgi:phosphoserine aminotransferase
MISFYPGPSKVWDSLPAYLQEAWQEGILSVNHRSPDFVAVSREAIRLLHDKMQIPDDYTILFTSSATECWEIIAQSILSTAPSLHLYNGAFGEKWHEYTQKLSENAKAQTFSLEELPEISALKPAAGTRLIALTHNETSNGTTLPDAFIKSIRQAFPGQLIAVDATSSMGGQMLPYQEGDLWYASVQKCFGLPAGLAIMICSPRAIERARELGEDRHYNSLLFMLEKIREAQTTYTPNVLGIYLLKRSLQDGPYLSATANMLEERFENWLQFFKSYPGISLLVQNPQLRSRTVLTLQGKPNELEQLKKAAKESGLYLGNGYGQWKNNTFRIANFPTLNDTEIQQLQKFLQSYKPAFMKN